LLLDRFEIFAKEQFKPWYTIINNGDSNWKYSKGLIDHGIMKKYASDPKTGTFLCRPPALVEKASKPALRDWGAKDGKNLFGF